MVDVDKINDNIKRLGEQSDEIIEVMSLKEQYKGFLDRFDNLNEKEKNVLIELNNIICDIEKKSEEIFSKIKNSEDKILTTRNEEKKEFLEDFLLTRKEVVQSFKKIEEDLKTRLKVLEIIANETLDKNEKGIEANNQRVALITKEVNSISQRLNKEIDDRKELLKIAIEESNNSINNNILKLEATVIVEKNNIISEVKKELEIELMKLNEKLSGFKREVSREIIHNITLNSEKIESSSKVLYDNIYSENIELKKANDEIKNKINSIEKEIVRILDEISQKFVEFEKENNLGRVELKNNVKESMKANNLEINNKILESNALYLQKINELLKVNEQNTNEINNFKKYGLVMGGVTLLLLILNIFFSMK